MARKQLADPPPDAPPSPAGEGYTVLARRYRPQDFTEVVGQEAVARSLVNAIKTGRVAHAYLFTGARGVGKTSTARILAKCLNCEKGPTPTPCGVCDMCRGITSGDDVDVLEVDAASNRGIDEIRNLRSNVQYRPSRARFKIYVIDEVHMLTREAFNALLKTLEEPPPHVKFFFATTDPHKIPVTILSRCQRFDLAGITLPLIKQRLNEIVAHEGMQADDEALELIARRAGGSLRDAQSLLDQLLAFGGDRLTADMVHQLLGTANEEHIVGLAESILAHNPAATLHRLDEASTGGFQMGELVDQLIAYWRDLMVAACGGEAEDLGIPGRFRATLTQQASNLTLDTILAGLDVLSTTRMRLRDSSHGRTLVEMALVRLGRLRELLPVGQLSQMLGQLGGVAPATPGPGGRTVLPPEALKKNDLSPVTDVPLTEPVALTQDTVPGIWAQVLSQVGSLLASDLRKSELPAIFGPNALALRFPSAYNQAREYCQDPARVARVEEALRKVVGRPISIRVEAGTPGAPTERLAPTPESPRPRRNPREDAEKEPLVKRALDVLGAQIVRADDGFGAPPDENHGAPRQWRVPEMFKEMGQFFSMMRSLPKIREEMDRLQQNLGQLTAEGDAGAGMVRVRVNGKMEVLGVRLSQELLKPEEQEMLEDLIRAASNQAVEKVRRLVAEETAKMATGLGLPPGVNLPGLT